MRVPHLASLLSSMSSSSTSSAYELGEQKCIYTD